MNTGEIRGLSLWQPWATMIAQGQKTIETRMWSTNYRGQLLICSTLRPEVPGHLCGFALCIAELLDCRLMTVDDEGRACCARDPGRWAWILSRVEPVEPFAVRGNRGLWRLSAAEIDELQNHRRSLACRASQS